MRDQALASRPACSVRNCLVLPCSPPIPEGVWNPFLGAERWPTPGPDIRSGIGGRFIPTSNARFPTDGFNLRCPLRVNSVRNGGVLSNTPVQALALLTTPSFHEAAFALATRMGQKSPAAPPERIRSGYRWSSAGPGRGHHRPVAKAVRANSRIHP